MLLWLALSPDTLIDSTLLVFLSIIHWKEHANPQMPTHEALWKDSSGHLQSPGSLASLGLEYSLVIGNQCNEYSLS